MNYWNKIVEFFTLPEGDGVRARDSKGRYKADDKSTASVNEAYKDGKKPKLKSKAKPKGKAKRGRGRPKGSKNKKK